jgi:hypothetical protein
MGKMYRVYSVVPRPKQEDFWLNIGAAYPHEDGQGFNIQLQALPVHGLGKLVMRLHEPGKEPGKAETGNEAAAS